jgi:hypothetical protein
MFAVSAAGSLLPPYVCYKATNLYDTWLENGPPGARYNRTPSGWFTQEVFEDWFLSIAVPYFRRSPVQGKKVIIGDNLSSHISFKMVKKAIEEDIHFVFFLPNSTHLLQPLDVAVFRPVKGSWVLVLRNWKEKNTGALQKSVFPKLLRKTIEQTSNMEGNIRSGFSATGIHPFNPSKVLEKIPDKEDPVEIGKRYLTPLISILHKNRLVGS